MKHEILVYNKTRKKIPKKFIKDVILRILEFLKLKQPAEMSVLVVNKPEIKNLNKTWRKKNYAPNELSFGLNSRKIETLVKSNNGVLNLGHIVVNSEKVPDRFLLKKVLIHGLLHLLGYGHEKSMIQAKKMECLESKIFENLNI